MKWIKPQDLITWSQSIASETEFPGMVADLIRASVSELTAFRFPNGDFGRVRGFDGVLETIGAPPFVPAGKSIWEFGTSDSARKADGDYAKRTAQVLAAERAESTFVLLSLNAYDTPTEKFQDWVAEKKARGEWGNVVFLDAPQLVHWLDEHPAVAAHWAKYHLGCQPQVGAKSIDEFWDEYAYRFHPALTEEVLLCDRQEQAEQLISHLSGKPSRIPMVADSLDEVIAFAVAAIRKAPAPISQFINSRALVVETPEAVRFLERKSGLIFLPRGQANQAPGLLARSGPTVVALGTNQHRAGDAKTLLRPTTGSFAAALKGMGFDDEKASRVARFCARNVTILARQIPSGTAPRPEWFDRARVLVPAFIAGGWDTQSQNDKAIVSLLSAGRSYDDYEADLRQFRQMQDLPFEQENSVWKVRAPVDAFLHFAPLVGPEHLAALKLAITRVFAEIEPTPDPDAPFEYRPRAPRQFSDWLRDGLATSVLLIATLSDQAGLTIYNQTPQAYVDDIVASIPGFSSDARIMMSLKSQLPILAEAAPSPLLAALEHLLEGNGERIQAIFTDQKEQLFPSSSHTNILWALETLAWDPQYLQRVSLVLAKLSRIDPGGRLSNRPISSLRNIFLPWHPSTNAPLQLRVAVLDSIIKAEPEVAWELLESILPKHHDSSSESSKPRFREAGEAARERLTYRLVWDGQREIVERAYAIAEEIPERWQSIIRKMSDFDPPLRSKAIGMIDALFGKIPAAARLEIWNSLREHLAWSSNFSKDQGGFDAAERAQIEDVLARNKPGNSVESVRWLFDDWTPNIVDEKKRRDKTELLRSQAVQKLASDGGVDAVLDLAGKAKLPQLVADAAVETAADPEFLLNLIYGGLAPEKNLIDFTIVLSGGGRRRFPEKWPDLFTHFVQARRLEPELIAKLLLWWPDEPGTWDSAAKFGADIDRLYWTTKRAWQVEGGPENARRAAEKYFDVNRYVAAIAALHEYTREVPVELVFRALDGAVAEVNANKNIADSMFVHYVETIFETLPSIEGVPKLEIVKREYAYLPILRHRDKPLTIHALMAESPDFYVSVLRDVFKASSAPKSNDEISPDLRERARLGFELLSSFETVPGNSGGRVDLECLRTWIQGVRRLATECDRADIADQYIGHVLAHAGADSADNGWPERPIREVIEELQAEQIERGLRIERFNMRGVFTKALYDGGNQERELAAQYRKWSVISAPWPRTAALLLSISEGWIRDADAEDVRARQDRMRDG